MAAAAAASFAAIRECRKLGTATAAMISMIATTISSSMSENPLCFCIDLLLTPNAAPTNFNLIIALRMPWWASIQSS
jgi:hypothetical protein